MPIVEDTMSVESRRTASTAAITVSTVSSTQSEKCVANEPIDVPHRAVHHISLSALSHNYTCVESAANRQRCSVIVVVKADGYGHGAIDTALHLADSCGAEAFAVATLEEAVLLRRAFENTPPFAYRKKKTVGGPPSDVSDLFSPLDPVNKTAEDSVASSRPPSPKTVRSMRPSRIRILVLGPPVGYPRCFDDYYHYDIELMVSGPEIAAALMVWVSNPNDRRRTQVARAAMDAKAQALTLAAPKDTVLRPKANEPAIQEGKYDEKEDTCMDGEHRAATLSNVSGQELAMEVRSILMNQHAVEVKKKKQPTPANSGASTPPIHLCPSHSNRTYVSTEPTKTKNGTNVSQGEVFGGIEQAVKSSRHREVAAARVNALESGEEDSNDSLEDTIENAKKAPMRRKLRWHALVDTGMGRLGFKTEITNEESKTEKKQMRDTVDILKDLVNEEVHKAAPIEFYGMCTHMAEANSVSSYTNAQMSRFLDLLERVRGSGIFVPTLSTDNSSALLTTSLTHFDPGVVLKQPEVYSRGWVRTGGAIYGQRPFEQLRAVSTLTASVRHVAVLKKGDSVGYDRAYVAPVDVRIATLTIGFADGYPRELGNGVGKASIRGKIFPVAGNVCMDMLMVELGPASDEATVAVGDVAYLWGPESEDDEEGGNVRLEDLAAKLRTTQSALTCGLDKIRVRRELV